MNCREVWIRFVAANVLFSAVFSLGFHAQQAQPGPNRIGLPKPVVDLTAGTWKYKETFVSPMGTDADAFSITIKDGGGAWTVTYSMESPFGPVTDVATIEKGTLILRKELFKHFLHKDAPWKPVEINLDFNGNKVTGAMKYVSRPERPVAIDLGGPVFAYVGQEAVIGCLPLADGYSTNYPYLDIEKLAVHPEAPNKETLMQLKVVGMERVTVPAGTFDSYKVELTSTDGKFKETVWIAKDSRATVKTSYVEGKTTGGTELVP